MAENNTTINVSYEFAYNIIPLTIMSVLGAASNICLLVAFIKDPLKCFRNSGTYLVMNLSVADCLFCLITPFEFTKIAGKIDSSSIITFLVFWFAGVSFASITSISIDRFLMVAYPMKHRILMKCKVIILWIAAIWIVIYLAIALPAFLDRGDRNIAYIVSIIFIIMLAVMCSSTYYKLKKQSRNIALQNTNKTRAEEIRIQQEKRFLKTIIVIACVASSCVVPYIFFLKYDSLSLPKDNLTFEVIGTASLVLFCTNFAVNPFIYILRLPNYRKTFYLLYLHKNCWRNLLENLYAKQSLGITLLQHHGKNIENPCSVKIVRDIYSKYDGFYIPL